VSVHKHLLPSRTVNRALTDALGYEVLKVEALSIRPGQVVKLEFDRVDSPWRQGIWVATEGRLRVGDIEASQFVIWTDTAPPQVVIECEGTDGLLRLYNVWQSGRRPGVESQSATSGMVVEDLGGGGRRYSCNDIGTNPLFQTLIFRLTLE
jgi:hypothetical protein